MRLNWTFQNCFFFLGRFLSCHNTVLILCSVLHCGCGLENIMVCLKTPTAKKNDEKVKLGMELVAGFLDFIRITVSLILSLNNKHKRPPAAGMQRYFLPHSVSELVLSWSLCVVFKCSFSAGDSTVGLCCCSFFDGGFGLYTYQMEPWHLKSTSTCQKSIFLPCYCRRCFVIWYMSVYTFLDAFQWMFLLFLHQKDPWCPKISCKLLAFPHLRLLLSRPPLSLYCELSFTGEESFINHRNP